MYLLELIGVFFFWIDTLAFILFYLFFLFLFFFGGGTFVEVELWCLFDWVSC